MNNWSDQINTPLNACSIETYVPVPNEDLVTNYCDSDVATSPPYDSVIPLVIGCYQLNESSAIGSAPETIYSSMSASRVGDSIDGEGASADVSGRSGELRLYMISSTTTTELMSPSTKAANKTRAKKEGVRFGDVSCVVKMESGVLDGKWRKRRRANRTSSASDCYEATPLFANACASGKIHLHYLQKERNTKGWSLLHLISSDDQPSTEESSLCLSLAWNDFIDMDYGGSSSNINADQIVSSYSNGKVALHRVLAGTRERELSNDDTGDIGDNWKNRICIEETHRWNAHHMFGCPSEVWTCSFLRDNANMVLSGADDCSLKIWDIRQTLRPMHTIGDSEFTAGVTAISPHPECSHVFAAGSYDEIVRVYDQRKLDEPMAKFTVGGGVWRIKWHPSCRGKMLVAAMHVGCRVVNIPVLDSTYTDSHEVSAGAEVLSEFTAHESMAYGADWLCFDQPCCDEVAVSCSFYDRKAFLWNPYDQPNLQSINNA